MSAAVERSFWRTFHMRVSLRKDWIKEETDLDKVRKTIEDWVRTALENEQRLLASQPVKKAEKPSKAAARKSSSLEPMKKPDEPFFCGQNSPKKVRKVATLEQWVEVTVENGRTVTRIVPSNEALVERGKRMWPAPELVYRRFNFPSGIPEEYYWTQDDPLKRKYGGAGIQRMTVETWLQMREREKDNPGGPLGPTPEGNLPRPRERGECECEVCMRNATLLTKWEASRNGRG